VMCVLMLRGAQTPGELKQRTERMHTFADLQAVHQTLERLIERELVERVERRPGHKEERYEQLLQAREEEPSIVRQPLAAVVATGVTAFTDDHDLGRLHERVARLEREVALLREAIGQRVVEHAP